MLDREALGDRPAQRVAGQHQRAIHERVQHAFEVGNGLRHPRAMRIAHAQVVGHDPERARERLRDGRERFLVAGQRRDEQQGRALAHHHNFGIAAVQGQRSGLPAFEPLGLRVLAPPGVESRDDRFGHGAGGYEADPVRVRRRRQFCGVIPGRGAPLAVGITCDDVFASTFDGDGRNRALGSTLAVALDMIPYARKSGALAPGVALLLCVALAAGTAGSARAQIDVDPERLLQFRPRTLQDALDPQALRRLFGSDGESPAPTPGGAQATSGAAMEWLEYGPPSRERHAMVYDSRRDRMLVVGGDRHHPAFGVWAMGADADSWEPIPSFGGDALFNSYTEAVYDSLGDRVIMGVNREQFLGPEQALGLWALELSGIPYWHPLAPGPPPVEWKTFGLSLAIDPDAGRLLLTGGRHSGDIWMLDLATETWSPLDTVTHIGSVVTYDRIRNRFLGLGSNGVWALEPGPPPVWTQLCTTFSAVGFAAMDVAHDRVILASRDLDVFDMPGGGGAVTLRSEPPPSRGHGTSGAAFAFDPLRSVLWAHGGYVGNYFESHSDGFRLTTSAGSGDWTWSSIPPTSGGTRNWQTMLIDEQQRQAVVVGGVGRRASIPPVVFHAFHDRNANATVPTGVTGPVPPQEFGQTAALDPVGRQVVYLSPYALVVRTMSLDAPYNWSTLTPGGAGPGPRRFAHFVYEAGRDRFLLFGGDDGSSYPAGIWELMLRPAPMWRQLAITWDDLPAPPAGGFMDDDGGYILLRFYDNTFGRFVLGDNGATFVSIPGTISLPRAVGAFGYDPVRNTLLLAERDDFGRFRTESMWRVTVGSSAEWEPLPVMNPRPYYRYLHGSAFSRTRDGIVLFGGWEDYDHDFDDWWVLEMQEPVPTLASLVRSDVSADGASLEWALGGEAASRVEVERREAATDWRSLGEGTLIGDDRVRFDDRALHPATRYGYRLRVTNGATTDVIGETWLETSAAASLALLGVERAPGASRWEVRFSLARAGIAELELFDVGGRRLARARLGGRATGMQRASLEAGGAHNTPGVFFVRLRTDEGTRVRRFATLQ